MSYSLEQTAEPEDLILVCAPDKQSTVLFVKSIANDEEASADPLSIKVVYVHNRIQSSLDIGCGCWTAFVLHSSNTRLAWSKWRAVKKKKNVPMEAQAIFWLTRKINSRTLSPVFLIWVV